MKTIVCATGLVTLLSASAWATPLIPSAAARATLQSALTLVAEAKWKPAPYGWRHGRKVGWGGRGLPPGQAKKLYR
jgi:hypothetical protein